MSKILHCPQTKNKKRTSLRLPKSMRNDIISILLKTGKSTKDVSAWISEAIINLEKDKNYHEIVAEELLDRGENIARPLSLSTEANEKLHVMKENIINKNHSVKTNTDINSKIIKCVYTLTLFLFHIIFS